jgi:hypothetical protein
MSRVVYENIPVTPEQEALRALHGVRVVSSEEAGLGVNQLPSGVYGFTYSPALPSAPLFAERRYRSFEMHKVEDVHIVGFVSAEVAREMASATGDLTVHVQPHPLGTEDTLVEIPYSRIRTHKQYAAPNQTGFTATLRPALVAQI